MIIGPTDSSKRSIAGAFGGGERYLGIKVATPPATGTTDWKVVSEISPRQRILSSPYAVKASHHSNVIPQGTVVPFAGTTIPSGWLLCDGSAVSRTTYADLYAAIADAWGSGDGATTFNLPDMRGKFLCGVDYGTGNDPDAAGRTEANAGGNTGDNVGSVQADALQGHWHRQYAEYNVVGFWWTI